MVASQAVGIITRGRPQQLDNLLTRLGELYGMDSAVGVIVVDNDASGSAGDVARRHAPKFVGGLRYEVERCPGYATARNRVVSMIGGAENLVFIDDDEVPEPGWLEALLDTSTRYGAAVVAGRVITVPPAGTPEAIVQAGFFEAWVGKQRRAGQAMVTCAAGNTLIHRSVFGGLPGGFDRRFDRTGGEDSHFFFRAALAGYKIAWCPTAIAVEYASSARAQPEWHLNRARHVGRTWTALDMELRRTPSILFRRCMRLFLAIFRGATMLVAGTLGRSESTKLRGHYELALAVGMTEGLRPSRHFDRYP